MTTDRRGFLLQATSATLALSSVAPHSVEAAAAGEATEDDAFVVTRTVARSGFDGQTCWVHARAGAIPSERFDSDAKHPLVVMTLQRLLLTGSDVFYALHESAAVVRLGAVLLGLLLAAAVAWMTEPGKHLVIFSKESVAEAKRVVWPTRKETIQTTGVVILFAVVMALFLWAVDASLMLLVNKLMGRSE